MLVAVLVRVGMTVHNVPMPVRVRMHVLMRVRVAVLMLMGVRPRVGRPVWVLVVVRQSLAVWHRNLHSGVTSRATGRHSR